MHRIHNCCPASRSSLPTPLAAALDNIEWGADYLMAAHSQRNRFVAVLGNDTLDVSAPPPSPSSPVLPHHARVCFGFWD